MVVYLPIALIIDWFSSSFHTDLLKNLYNGSSVFSSSAGLDILLRINDMRHGLETDMRSCLLINEDLGERKEGWSLVVKNAEDEPQLLEQKSEHCSWEIAKCSFYLAPIWFITEIINMIIFLPLFFTSN